MNSNDALFLLGENGVVAAGMPEPSVALAWKSAAPDPSRGAVRLTLALPRAAPARVRVYNAAGRAVRLLYDGSLPAGPSVLVWDGRGDDGSVVPTGVYWVAADVGGSRATRRLVHLR